MSPTSLSFIFMSYMRYFAFSVLALMSFSTVGTLFAADVATVSPSSGSSAGEYKAVDCASNSTFGINNCDQCFDGGNVKTGERLTGIYDYWFNNSTSSLIAYKDEQKVPNIVKLGNSVWSMNPASEAAIWKNSSDIVWLA